MIFLKMSWKLGVIKVFKNNCIININNENFKKIFINVPALIIVSVALIAVTIVISCFRDFYRRYVIPIFIIFTGLFAILVAISITAYTSKVIIMAVVATLVVTIGLTIYACNQITLLLEIKIKNFMFCITNIRLQ